MKTPQKLFIALSVILVIVSAGLLLNSLAIKNNQRESATSIPSVTASAMVSPLPVVLNAQDNQKSLSDIDEALNDMKISDLPNDDFKDFGSVE